MNNYYNYFILFYFIIPVLMMRIINYKVNISLRLTKTKDEVKRCLLLDIIVRKRPSVLKLFSRKNEALLVGRNTLLVLNLLFHVFNGIRCLDVERDGLSGKRLDEDLHMLVYKCVYLSCIHISYF